MAPAVAEPSFSLEEDLRRLAISGLDRVLLANSELTELWDGDDMFAATVSQIRDALAG